MTADEERDLRAQIAAEVADAPLVPTGGASRRAQRDADLRIIRGAPDRMTADDERNRLRLFARLVSDLDRSPNGRHEGDAEVQDPTGVSQGNPHLREGVVFGYTMGGRPIRMPPRALRDDPEAWIGTVEP